MRYSNNHMQKTFKNFMILKFLINAYLSYNLSIYTEKRYVPI